MKGHSDRRIDDHVTSQIFILMGHQIFLDMGLHSHALAHWISPIIAVPGVMCIVPFVRSGQNLL